MAHPNDPLEAQGPDALGLDPALALAGLNLAGVLSPAGYDAIVPAGWRVAELLPEARSAVVLGSAGPGFFHAARHWQAESGDARDPGHPVDEFCQHLLAAAAQHLEQAGWKARPLFYFERRGSPAAFADFIALARACGLGAPSRLGLLLSSIHGPWFAIRSVLLSDRPFAPSGVLDHFDPCADCPAPCVTACHGAAVDSRKGPFNGEACARARREIVSCSDRCDARIACPLGSGSAYDAEALAHHMRADFYSQQG